VDVATLLVQAVERGGSKVSATEPSTPNGAAPPASEDEPPVAPDGTPDPPA
jgi:hypothetical protein